MRIVQSQMKKTGSSRSSFTTTAPRPSSLPPSHLWCVMWGKYQQASRPVTNLSVKNILWMAGLRGRHWLVGAGDRWGVNPIWDEPPIPLPMPGPCECCNFPDV